MKEGGNRDEGDYKDSKQEKPLKNEKVEKQMIRHLVRLMKENDAPPEQYERLGLQKEKK